MRSTRDYLLDMQGYIIRMEQTTRDGKMAFFDSFIIQDAVIRQYEVIGEIAKRLPDDLLATQTAVDWRSLKGFRDFLAHNYDRVDLATIWEAVEKLTALHTAVDALLNNLPDDDSDAGDDG